MAALAELKCLLHNLGVSAVETDFEAPVDAGNKDTSSTNTAGHGPLAVLADCQRKKAPGL